MRGTMGFAYHPQREGAVLKDGDSVFLLMLWSLAGRYIDIHVSMFETLVLIPDDLAPRAGWNRDAELRAWRPAKAWRKN